MPKNGVAFMKVYLFVQQSGAMTPNLNTTAKLLNVDQYDSNSSNNEMSCPINAAKAADIQVNQTYTTYTDSDNKQYVTYTITINNNGPDNATNLKITDKLPTGLTYISSNAPTGTTYNSTTGIWDIGNFNIGDAQKILTITAQITATETIKNTASKTSQGERDWQQNNNQQTTILPSGYVPSVDIQVWNYPWYYDALIDDFLYDYGVGNTPVFIADVENIGTDDATGVVVQYTFGDGFKYISCNTQGIGTVTYNNNILTWNIGSMPKNGVAFMKVYLIVQQSGAMTPNLNTTAKLLNVDQYDSNSSNNEMSCPINAAKAADIQVNQTYTTYTDSDNKQYVTYTITINNNGPDNATNLKITDKLPTGLTYISSNAPTGTTYNSTTGIWDIGNFNFGDAQKTLTITAQITGTETIKNTASKTSQGERDWQQNNNQQTTLISVPN